MDGITQEQILNFIKAGIAEDVHEGDHTSLACIPAESVSTARLIAKDNGIIAGVELAEKVFKYLDPNATIEIFKKDGEFVNYMDEVFHITCNSQALLKGERLVLNTMQRMSGISTISHHFVDEVAQTDVKILDTRKTTPLLRFLEKWAVRIGGCQNYRDGLYDWIMIKDNHIDACGSITKAIQKANDYLKANNLELGITVEVRNLVELHEVLAIGQVTRIMLDNFEIPILAEAVATIDKKFESEASGGITLNTIRKVAKTGVNYISVGALTHSAGVLDLSLKVMK